MIPWYVQVILLASSLLLVGLGLPMALRKVPPNDWYGFRAPVTLRSRAAWYAGNAHSGWWIVAGGLLSLPIAIYGLIAGGGLTMIWVFTGLSMGPLLVGIIPALIVAYRAEARSGDDDGSSSVEEIPEHFRK